MNCADGDSGVDNRNLADDGTSQKLTRDEILELKNSGATGEEVSYTSSVATMTFIQCFAVFALVILVKQEHRRLKLLF